MFFVEYMFELFWAENLGSGREKGDKKFQGHYFGGFFIIRTLLFVMILFIINIRVNEMLSILINICTRCIINIVIKDYRG